VNKLLFRHQWPCNKLRLILSSSFISDPVRNRCSQSAQSSSICDVTQLRGLIHSLILYILAFQGLCDISSDCCIVWTIFLHTSAVEYMDYKLGYERRASDLLSHDEHSPKHSPGCQWHYWSFRLQEAKNSFVLYL